MSERDTDSDDEAETTPPDEAAEENAGTDGGETDAATDANDADTPAEDGQGPDAAEAEAEPTESVPRLVPGQGALVIGGGELVDDVLQHQRHDEVQHHPQQARDQPAGEGGPVRQGVGEQTHDWVAVEGFADVLETTLFLRHCPQ